MTEWDGGLPQPEGGVDSRLRMSGMTEWGAAPDGRHGGLRLTGGIGGLPPTGGIGGRNQ